MLAQEFPASSRSAFLGVISECPQENEPSRLVPKLRSKFHGQSRAASIDHLQRAACALVHSRSQECVSIWRNPRYRYWWIAHRPKRLARKLKAKSAILDGRWSEGTSRGGCHAC